jgi:hypothetical protein
MMRRRWFVRVFGMSVLLLVSGLGVAGATPRAPSVLVSSASVGAMKGAAWRKRPVPSFKGACGAVVMAGTVPTFACHKRLHDIYYAGSGASPTRERSLVS